MRLDLDTIERVARLAQERSPGPWRRVHLTSGGMREPRGDESTDYIYDSAPKPEGFDDYDGGTWDGNRVVETDGGFYEPEGVTAEHIARCSPDVVLALVARIRELEMLLPTDDERRAAHWFVEGSDSIRECYAVMEMLKRIAVKQ